jgi:peptidyl-prolyl cis-trans isomerase SurA
MTHFKTIFVAFFLSISGYYSGLAQSFVVDQVIGIVGNKSIKQSDVEEEYSQMIKNGTTPDPSLKCDIFGSLVKSKMLLNQAMLDSLQVSEPQIESEITQRINNFVLQIGSAEKLEKYFDKSMQEIKDDLRKNYRDMQLVNKMQGTIVGDIEITPTEVKSFYNKLSKDSIPRINAQIQIAQIAAYPPYSDQAILDVKDKLLDFRKRILAGEKFEVLARLYSEDPGSSSKGGEYGFMAKGDLDPEFAKAAFALNSPGEISRIVESSMGFHIIQYLDKRSDRMSFRHILLKPKIAIDISVKVKNTLDSIADLIRKDSISFEDAVKIYSMDNDTRFNGGIVVNPSNGGTQFELDQFTPADYYVIKKLKVGQISEAYESRDSKGKIIYKIVTVKSQTPAHIANLTEDYNLLQGMAINFKKKSVLDDWFIEKRKSIFIHIDKSYMNCPFTSEKWFKLEK